MKNLLYITARIPSPDQRGDQIRAFHQLRMLSNKAKVTLVCLTSLKDFHDQIAPLEDLGIDVHCFRFSKWQQYLALRHSIFSRLPFQVAYFYSKRAEKLVCSLFEQRTFDIVHCHLIRTIRYAQHLRGTIRSIDYMDAYGFGMNLRYSNEKGILKRILFKAERNRLLHFESRCFDEFDLRLAISKQDALRIEHPQNNEIIVSANGVDFHQFYPKETGKQYDLVFMGNMDYAPNIVAVSFIVNEVLPKVKEKIPTIKLLIAGRGATPLVQSYQSRSVDVVQQFDDISDAISSAKIMLAPMMISIGLQNKLLQAMAMKVPCITSQAANGAIGATPNEHILIANTTDEFIAETLKLLEDESLQNSISEAAYTFVHQYFTWEHCVQQIPLDIS